MVREVFLGLEAAIPAIAGRAVEAGGRIRVGVPAAPFIGKIAEDLAFVVDAYRTGLNLVGPDGPRDAPPRREASSRIEDVLNEVLSGIASEDMVAIGDVLEHQFGPALEALLLEIRERRSALGPEGGAAR